MSVRPLYKDAFNPVLFSSVPLNVTDEQKFLLKVVLDIACSDTQFADKAYQAVIKILTSQPTVKPVITSLTPSSAVIGSTSFTLHVRGTGFTSKSVIIFAGQDEPTTFVSPTEVTTGVDMSFWHGPDVLPVLVTNDAGVTSNSMNFTFLPAVATAAVPAAPSVTVTTAKVEVKK